VREILIAVGEDPDREGLVETPNRVARAYEEVFAGLHRDPAEVLDVTFDISHEELVLVRDIDLYSTCEHHLVPFHGVAHIGYIPSRQGKVTGLSKLARLVEIYARRPPIGAYDEVFAGLHRDPAEVLDVTFDISHEELVLVRDIDLYSTCEHHLVPFHGVAHIGYIPSRQGKVTGLSKLARLVEIYARRPQVQ